MEVTRELFQFSERRFELANLERKVTSECRFPAYCKFVMKWAMAGRRSHNPMGNLLSRQSILQRPGRSEMSRQGNEYGSPWHKHQSRLATCYKFKRTSVMFWGRSGRPIWAGGLQCTLRSCSGRDLWLR
jgi:hypothetical protein